MHILCSNYKSKEAASGVVTDQNITGIAAFASLFSDIGVSNHTIIKTDALITVRFNDVANDAITIAANSQMELDWLPVKSIFITAGSSANLKIIVAR